MSLISYDRAVMATKTPKPSVELPEERIRGDTEGEVLEPEASTESAEYRDSTELSPQQDIGGSSGSESEAEGSEEVTESVPERPMPILTDESEAKLKAEEPQVLPARSSQIEEPKVSKAKVSEKPKEKPKRVVSKSSAARNKPKSDTIQLQHFSREAMDYVRHEIGESKRREHALEAYLYIKSGGGFSISEEAMELVRAYGGDKSIVNMDARIARIETKLNSLLTVLYELELSMSYVLLDRAGLGGRVPATIKEIDLAGQASLETREHLRISARDQQKRDSYTSGRPIR